VGMSKENQKTSYEIYIDSIKDIPLLVKEEEEKLSDIINAEVKEPELIQKAIDKLVLSNLRLSIKYAKEYHDSYKNIREYSLSLMDLIEEGNIGLIKGAASFNYSKGRFTTHASWHIKKWIRQAQKNHRFIRIPVNHHAVLNKVRMLELEEKPINKPDIAKEFDMSEGLLNVIIVESRNKVQSLNVPASDGDSVVSMLDIIASEEESGATKIEKEEEKAYLMRKIETLSKPEQKVIFARFFSDTPATFEEIAKAQGVSKQRISQISDNALKKLKKKIKEDRALGNN
jgi:RNA polymerase primary sigma factor